MHVTSFDRTSESLQSPSPFNPRVGQIRSQGEIAVSQCCLCCGPAVRDCRYGVHLFHTVHERVWEYVNRFSEWMPYEHRVKGRIDGKKNVPIPPSQLTVNQLFDANVNSEEEMEAWLEARRVKNDNPKVNSRPAR
eukprot:7925828-Pyramimonas_sp.AAC.1